MNDGTDSLTYDYNQFDQLTALSKNNEVQTTYEYDLRGNQTKESTKHFDLTVGGVTTTYYNTTDHTYNLRNQMISANISTPEADAQTGEVTYNTVETSNIYNAQGQRIQKTEGNETTKYFYSGSAVFYTTDGGGALNTENILDLGGQIVASKRFPDPDEVGSPFANKYFFYNYDIRGSVTNIVGPDGNLVTGYGYDEFGNQERKGDTSFLNEVTFTGSISDTSTGLQYMNARFYQPTTGRFLSQDSYTGNAYDPWTQNLYAYCGNNPTNFVDPTGHFLKALTNLYKKAATALQAAAKVVPVLSKPLNAAAKVAYTVANNYEQVVKTVAAAKQAKATQSAQTPASPTPKKTPKTPAATPKEESPQEEEKEPEWYIAPIIEVYELVQGLPENQRDILGEVNRQYGTGPFQYQKGCLTRRVEGGTLVILSSSNSKRFLTELQNTAAGYEASAAVTFGASSVACAGGPIGWFCGGVGILSSAGLYYESVRNAQIANGLQNYNDLSKGSAFVVPDRGGFVFFTYDG